MSKPSDSLLRPERANSIDEVLERMDRIIQHSIATSDRIGYFAAMYRLVTEQVKHEIAAGRFEDGERMERLDVIFANRFLDAYDAYIRGEPCSECWQVAFDATRRGNSLVLQHLLLGMNAHINFDLGIAAVDTCAGQPLEPLHHDFNAINDVLASLIDDIKSDLDRISPWIGWLDRLGGKSTDAVIRFSMDKARSFAWLFAVSLDKIDEIGKPSLLRNKDAAVAALGREVLRPPGWLLKAAIWAIRLRESNQVASNIRLLCDTTNVIRGAEANRTMPL